MHYMITFPLTREYYAERVGRFLETGAPPPEGCTLHERWFSLGHSLGYMLVESDDPKAVFGWISQWADIIDFEVDAVISDQDAAEVLAGM